MNRPLFLLLIALTCAMAGCDTRDERLAQFAAESTRQQADQNLEMAQLNRETAQAHQDLIGLQQDLEKRQAEINHGRDQLESERRDIAQQRHRDPIIAAAITNVGLVLACLAPLALAAYLLYCHRDQQDDHLVSEILIEEIASERPVLLPPPQMAPRSLGHLPGPDTLSDRTGGR